MVRKYRDRPAGPCNLAAGHPGVHRTKEQNDRNKANHHGWMVKSTYGITPEEYQELKAAQGGKCVLCRRATGAKKRLAVDHDHAHHPESPKTACRECVRGLLCGRCNNRLGWVEAVGLDRISAYLSQPPARGVLK